MNSTQNQKINQVKETTLVIGVDIAKFTHYASFLNARGQELEKVRSFKQSREGFESFYTHLQAVMARHQKTDVIVGIEPTGHYWLNLAYFLEDHGIRLVMVNPMHVKKAKELDDNLPTKHDAKDARTIGRLVKDGRFSYPRILHDHEAELRAGSALRASMTEELGMIKNKMVRWTDRYFPEFTQVFPTFGKMALAVLEQTPFPEEVATIGIEEWLDQLRQSEGLKSPQKPKARRLQALASQSIGIQEGHQMARIEIATLVCRYRQVEQEIAALSEQLTLLVRETTSYEVLQTVPGLGDATITDLLAETGDLTNYEHPRQLLKLAGLTLKESSSGQHTGQKRISKRGRRRLRALLFRVMIPLVRHNQAFRELHEQYTSRPLNPLRKKQSLVVLCGKLLKVLHALVVKQEPFNGSKLLADVTRFQAA